MVQPRSFWTYFLLSLVTCGIYGIFWLYNLQKDINTICEDGKDVNPVMMIVLFMVTFGIYPLFWYYSQGDRLYDLGVRKGVPVNEKGTTYLLWTILGAFIVVGPLIAMLKFVGNFNSLAAVYNSQKAA